MPFSFHVTFRVTFYQLATTFLLKKRNGHSYFYLNINSFLFQFKKLRYTAYAIEFLSSAFSPATIFPFYWSSSNDKISWPGYVLQRRTYH